MPGPSHEAVGSSCWCPRSRGLIDENASGPYIRYERSPTISSSEIVERAEKFRKNSRNDGY